MTIPWDTVDVPIGSLNTQRDPKLGPVGRLLRADNVVMRRPGELSLRNGFSLTGSTRWGAGAAGPSAATNTVGRGIASFDGRLLGVFDDASIAHYSPSAVGWVTQSDDWNMAQRRWETQLGAAFRSDEDSGSCDIAVNPGGTHALVAWADGATYGRYAIVELATDAIVYLGSAIYVAAGISNPRCTWDETGLYAAVFWTYGAAEIRCNSMTWNNSTKRVTANTASANLIGAAGTANHKNFDVCQYGTKYFLVWTWWDGVSANWVASWLSVGVGTVTPSAIVRGTHSMGASGAGNDSRVAFARPPASASIRVVARGVLQDYRYFSFDSSTLAQGALTTTTDGQATHQRAATLSAYYASGALLGVFGEGAESDSATEMVDSSWTGKTPTGKMATTAANLDSSPVYLMGCYDQAQPTAYLVTRGDVHAVALPSICEVQSNRQTWEWLPQLHVISGDLLVTVLLQNVAVQATAAGTVYRSVPRLVRFVRRANVLGQVAAAADALLVAGGVVSCFDGARVALNNPIVYPEPPGVASYASGSKGAGVYKVRTCWAWTDNAGRIHRSAPSLPTSFTRASLGGLSVTFDSDDVLRPNIGSRGGAQISLSGEIYCTEANGDTYYLEQTIPAPNSNYLLTLSDADLRTREPLYTTGGQLDNFPFPSISALAHWQNRAWGVSSERPERIHFSHEIRDGEAAATHPSLWVEAADAEGGFVALAQTDRALIALKRHAVYAISGDGPNRLGQGSFAIQQVATGYGASSAEAVAAIPDGVVFRGDRGVCLLDRGFGITYIGAPIEGQLASKTVVGTAVLAARSMVAFVTSDAWAFVYDYLNQQWYRWSLPSPTTIVACCEHGGYLAVQDAGGRVWLETEGTTYDNGTTWGAVTAITPTVEFAPLTLSGIAGFWRLREVLAVGQRDADSRLTASLRYDYSSTVSETIAGDMTAAKGAMAGFKPARQKAAAVGISLALSWPSAPNYGAGFRLSGLTLVVGRKRGGNKAAAHLTD